MTELEAHAAAIRELHAQLGRIEAQLRETQPRHEGEGDRPLLIRHLEELKAAMAKAREAGQREVVEQLEREVHEVLQRLGERPGDRPRPEAEAAEAQRRLAHVRAAIGNLHAAGMHDQAEALARQTEAWTRERGMPPGRPPEGRPGAERRERPDMPPPAPHLERAVMEMREQVRALQEQMEDLRRALHELRERPQR
jgi:chromosome segregation ATPase